MLEFRGSLVKYPARVSLVWYIAVILLGSLLLWLPLARVTEGSVEPISPIDALFTATSATCVTGLAVRSTGHAYSFWGQLIILLLIQLGGVGIMTVTSFIMFRLGGKADLRSRTMFAEATSGNPRAELRSLLRSILLITIICEGGGFALLAVRFLFEYPFLEALWQALFHSVSAFCNAGFGLHDDNLERYRDDVLVNGVISALIVIGGIGYPVILDLLQHRQLAWSERWNRLHLHSKLMLIGTASLIFLGAIVFLVLEWDNALEEVPLWARPMVAMFHSITCRTAGFNTVPISTLTNASLFISILLMAIGAGPGSTGGGFKVSTMMVLVAYAWTAFKGGTRINIFRRTIPLVTTQRAVATAMLFGVIAVVALTALLMVEQSWQPHHSAKDSFLDAMFEVISALGTVGLSTGITAHLSWWGKFVMIALMFAGRLGPISVFLALSRSEKKMRYEYPQEEPLIG